MTTVYKGGTLIDGTGRPPVDNAWLIVKNGKIVFAGQKSKKAEGKIEGNTESGQDIDIIDVTGKTILPGLIDVHIHMDLHGYANTNDESFYEDKLRTLRSGKEMERTVKKGITTVRNAGSVNYIDFAVKKAVELGWYTGPRIMTSGKVVTTTAKGNDYFPGLYREADGSDEVRKAVREQIKAGADFIKIMATGAYMNPGGIPGAVQMNLDEIKVVVEEARKNGMRVASHAHGKKGILNSIVAGVDTIEHATCMDDEVIELLVKHEIPIVPTYVVGHLFLKHGEKAGIPAFMIEKTANTLELKQEGLRKAIKAGVKVAFGSDAGTSFNFHGNNALELKLLVEEGFLNPLEAIKSGTQVSAEALGIEKLTGTLEKGKAADFIVVDGVITQSLDPLMEKIEMVYLEGKKII